MQGKKKKCEKSYREMDPKGGPEEGPMENNKVDRQLRVEAEGKKPLSFDEASLGEYIESALFTTLSERGDRGEKRGKVKEGQDFTQRGNRGGGNPRIAKLRSTESRDF